MIAEIVEKLTDDTLALSIVGVGLTMAALGMQVPEWLVVSTGMVLKYYFDKKEV